MALSPTSSHGSDGTLVWTAVTGGVGFTNGWVDYGNGYGAVGYAPSGGLVYLRGVADATAASADGAFTLPLALRPSVKRITNCYDGGNVGAFEVLTTGVVSVFQRPGAGAIAFDGVVFSL